MVKAVLSVSQRYDQELQLQALRLKQLETFREKGALNTELELLDLYQLFRLIGLDVTITLATITSLLEIDTLIQQDKTILVGLPQSQHYSFAHIAHLKNIVGDWGYRSTNEEQYTSKDWLLDVLMGQVYLQLFIIE